MFSVSPRQLKHLSLRKEVVSGHPGNLGLVGGSGFLPFFLLWQWLHGISRVAVIGLAVPFEQCMGVYDWDVFTFTA